ncbi:Retrieval of early ER protein Rer [Parasponia andersonii]|uniref:Retrieval of early ER protein Rer n=1 Tax=Parasponia andersonii TaxID=3476 RepID=A0A2P5B2X4_PARAD|nr:Retrieval of early ER protein Rer [Parasponia andersonii]
MDLFDIEVVLALFGQVDVTRAAQVARLIYSLCIYLVQGFYIVSYELGIYILNIIIGFLFSQVDPEIQDLSSSDGFIALTLPTRGSNEFSPFVRHLFEFKFCRSSSSFLKPYFIVIRRSRPSLPFIRAALHRHSSERSSIAVCRSRLHRCLSELPLIFVCQSHPYFFIAGEHL